MSSQQPQVPGQQLQEAPSQDQQSELLAQPAQTEQLQQWQRLSKLSPLLDSFFLVVAIVGFVIANLSHVLTDPDVLLLGNQLASTSLEDNQGFAFSFSILVGPLLVLALLALMLLVFWLQWYFRKYSITAEKLEYRWGALIRQQRVALLHRVQGVDLAFSILARIFGHAAVVVTTAAGDFRLNYLKKADALALQQQLLQAVSIAQQTAAAAERSTETATAAAPVQVAEVPQAVAAQQEISAGQALATEPAAVTDTGVVASAADVAPATAEPSLALRIAITRVVAGALHNIGLLLLPVLVIIMFVTVMLLARAEPTEIFGVFGTAFWIGVLSSVPAVLPVVNKSWNFTLKIDNNGLQTTAGLTTKTTESLPLRRINALQITQPTLWRLRGWYKLEAYSSGFGAERTGKTYTLLPIATLQELHSVLEQILPGITVEQDFNNALRKGVPLQYHSAKRAAPLVVLSSKNTAGQSLQLANGEQLFLARNGLLGNHLGIIRLPRAQGVLLTRPFWQGLFGLWQVTVPVPGNNLLLLYYLRGCDKTTAQNLFQKLVTATSSNPQEPELPDAK